MPLLTELGEFIAGAVLQRCRAYGAAAKRPSDGCHEARRLQQGRDAAVGWSALLANEPLPKRSNDVKSWNSTVHCLSGPSVSNSSGGGVDALISRLSKTVLSTTARTISGHEVHLSLARWMGHKPSGFERGARNRCAPSVGTLLVRRPEVQARLAILAPKAECEIRVCFPRVVNVERHKPPNLNSGKLDFGRTQCGLAYRGSWGRLYPRDWARCKQPFGLVDQVQ
jgi:hypothetical protein